MTKPATRATIKDVAALAGVDRAVVSKVLRDDPSLRVREETRQRVREAAETLNYRPNIFAQGLATQRSGAFGLLIPTYRNPVYSEIVVGAEAVATERSLLLWTASTEGSETDSFTSVIQGGLLEGLLIAGSRTDTEGVLANAPLPTLLVNRRGSGSRRWVILDDEAAASIATHHLIDLGHERIGFVAGPSWADTAPRRHAGYVRAMEESGLRANPDYLVGADYTPTGGADAAVTLAAMTDRPTAIVVANALTALGVWKGLRQAGIRVPEEMSIVGIHHLPSEEHRPQPLTTVDLPLTELGRLAAELLLDSTANADIEAVVETPPRLVPGATTAPPA